MVTKQLHTGLPPCCACSPIPRVTQTQQLWGSRERPGQGVSVCVWVAHTRPSPDQTRGSWSWFPFPRRWPRKSAPADFLLGLQARKRSDQKERARKRQREEPGAAAPLEWPLSAGSPSPGLWDGGGNRPRASPRPRDGLKARPRNPLSSSILLGEARIRRKASLGLGVRLAVGAGEAAASQRGSQAEPGTRTLAGREGG